MPTYVYSCSACNTVFEVEQRITEDALDTCNCGSRGTVKRIIQPVGISFKGSGFHINDYSPAVAPSVVETKPADAAAPAAAAAEPPATEGAKAAETPAAAPAPAAPSE